MNEIIHKPVLLKESIEALNVIPNEKYVDGTVGAGGHSCEIIKSGGIVLGIDMDPEALKIARKTLEDCSEAKTKRFTLEQENFANLREIAERNDFLNVSGILFDLGLSSFQLDYSPRGFSFKRAEPLDMRMDPSLGVTAADLVNGLTEGELYELFTKFGEEPFARLIARRIVTSRLSKKIATTSELAFLVEQAVGFRGRREKIHPATRVFQALRIAVNDELNNLRVVLPQALALTKSGGRVVVISFHSLEDRIVKNYFLEEGEKGTANVLTKKPVTATDEEVIENPRARSAKMRVIEKV
ncbi:MAG: 16S rRNA (cytosine(1402)-N(4))-methyltransferase RsmH [Patescibacteria group bacterium]|nr:16S rRNA (cytosine(1402)-N(4))-methyltransferase RsmH [Patescibacteria group bacterium]